MEMCARLELMIENESLSEADIEVIRDIESRLDLRKQIRPVLKFSTATIVVLKIIICVCVAIIIAPFEIIASVLTLFNPIWAKLNLKKNNLPTEMLQLLTFRWGALCFGLEVHVEGKNNVPDVPVVFMYSHASNLDPLAIGAVAPCPLRFIGKKAIFLIPLFGWLFMLYGHIPIDRHNRESAIESLKSAARSVRRSKASIAISPEGTRSVTGHLQKFKKGPFHLAAHTRMPIVPVIINDAYDLMPVGHILPHSGVLTIRYLEPIMPPEGNDPIDVDHLSRTVRVAMLQGLSEPAAGQADVYLFHETLVTILPAAIIIVAAAYLYLSRN